MKQSRRARRMERSHVRNGRTPAFNLVSLMDIFTILVFFLLVNSSDGEVLPTTRNIELPESISEARPRHNVVIMVTAEDILVQGRRVAAVTGLDRDAAVIATLQQALQQQRQPAAQLAGQGDPAIEEVTIMGTRQIPYRLLKQVMASCTEAGYSRISLAVLQKPVAEG